MQQNNSCPNHCFTFTNGTINTGRIEVVSSTLSERYQKAASALPALMPRWTPARHKGQAVACLATMEVLF